MESLESVRALLVTSRPASWNLGYPPAVRDRVAAYATARRAAGTGMSAIAAELGVSRHSVVSWSKPPAGEPPRGLVPVEVTSEASMPAQRARLASMQLGADRAALPVLVSPRGFRVEGLGLDALGALLERLG